MIRKLLASVAVVAGLGSFAALGVYSAFSNTTTNDNNRIQAGTVVIGDNDANAALYSITSGAKPGDYQEHCIKVTYSGSLPANVKVYRSTVGALGPYVQVKVYKGTGNAFDCTGFTDTNGGTPIIDTTLSSLGTNWAGGTQLTNASGSNTWSQNDAVTYRIRGTLNDDNSAQGLDTNLHTFTWEAQNT
jgi:hypothetical protein